MGSSETKVPVQRELKSLDVSEFSRLPIDKKQVVAEWSARHIGTNRVLKIYEIRRNNEIAVFVKVVRLYKGKPVLDSKGKITTHTVEVLDDFPL